MKAFVVNRKVAEHLSPCADKCHIVLQEPGHRYDVVLPRAGWHDSIVFNVHDITAPIKGFVHFTEEMGKELVGFVERNKGRDFLVNCDAGLSRSVAVGCVLRDRFGYPVEFMAGTDIHRNALICRTVNRILDGY